MAGPVYRAEPAQSLHPVDLGGMIALYHRPSARTHLVASPVPEMIEALGAGPLDADALLAALAQRYDLADADRASLVARLEELESAGLIRRG